MNDMEKLRVILPHWIEHNKNHEKEFNKWLAIISSGNETEVAALLKKAVSSLQDIDTVLSQISDKIGALKGENSQDHTHHH
jgi:hypothetical protein